MWQKSVSMIFVANFRYIQYADNYNKNEKIPYNLTYNLKQTTNSFPEDLQNYGV
jgi:hypothetical protein